jgi:hypothetical protein
MKQFKRALAMIESMVEDEIEKSREPANDEKRAPTRK